MLIIKKQFHNNSITLKQKTEYYQTTYFFIELDMREYGVHSPRLAEHAKIKKRFLNKKIKKIKTCFENTLFLA